MEYCSPWVRGSQSTAHLGSEVSQVRDAVLLEVQQPLEALSAARVRTRKLALLVVTLQQRRVYQRLEERARVR